MGWSDARDHTPQGRLIVCGAPASVAVSNSRIEPVFHLNGAPDREVDDKRKMPGSLSLGMRRAERRVNAEGTRKGLRDSASVAVSHSRIEPVFHLMHGAPDREVDDKRKMPGS